MKTTYFKNDFLLDMGPEAIYTGVEWIARISTANTKEPFEAASNRPESWRLEKGNIVVPVDNHSLAPGVVVADVEIMVPDDRFPDRAQRTFKHCRTDLRLSPTMDADGCGCNDTGCMPEGTPRAIIMDPWGLYAFGHIIDSINRSLEEILGYSPVAPDKPEEPDTPDTPDEPQAKPTANSFNPYEPKVVQRGIISIFAKPGVLYRNLGYIRLPMHRATKRTFDLSKVTVHIEGIKIRGNTTDWSYEYNPNKQSVEVRCPSFREHSSARAKIFSVHPYLMKDFNGFIRGVSECAAIQMQLASPELKSGWYSNKDTHLLENILINCGVLRDSYDLMIKRRKGSHRLTPRGRKWTYFIKDSKRVAGFQLPKMGIARIRHTGGKGIKSLWITFSFTNLRKGFLIAVL